MFSDEEVQTQIAAAARTLVTVGPLMPNEEALAAEIQDAVNASERGYFLPDEDERVRTAFAQYLRTRKALFETLNELRPLVLAKNKVSSFAKSWTKRLPDTGSLAKNLRRSTSHFPHCRTFGSFWRECDRPSVLSPRSMHWLITRSLGRWWRC